MTITEHTEITFTRTTYYTVMVHTQDIADRAQMDVKALDAALDNGEMPDDALESVHAWLNDGLFEKADEGETELTIDSMV